MPRSNSRRKLYVDVRCGSVYTDRVLPGDRFIQNLKDYGPGPRTRATRASCKSRAEHTASMHRRTTSPWLLSTRRL